MDIVTSVKYEVKQVNSNKYLHINKSKYGESINLTEGLENAQKYDTIIEARKALIKYLCGTKTMTAAMFDIIEVEITTEVTQITCALPDSETISCLSYGIVPSESTQYIKETTKKMLEAQYKNKVADFELVKTPDNYILVKNIIWVY